MRLALAAFVVLLGGSWFDPAKADPYAWCAEYSGGGLGGAKNCYFLTLAAVPGHGLRRRRLLLAQSVLHRRAGRAARAAPRATAL